MRELEAKRKLEKLMRKKKHAYSTLRIAELEAQIAELQRKLKEE